MIGVGITTSNRRETALKCINEWRSRLPWGNIKLIVVDDASDIPFPNADFRFDTNVGICTAKNKCLELLDDCEYIFLADDDIYPTDNYWYLPYTLSDLNHACYTFGRPMLKATNNFISFSQPCGCLLFFRSICLKTVGGFDTEFIKYGYEHVNLSDRIYNCDLTPARYIDIPNSLSYFRALDMSATISSSMSKKDKIEGIVNNAPLLEKYKDSKKFIPYK